METFSVDIKASGAEWMRPGCPWRCALEDKSMTWTAREHPTFTFFFSSLLSLSCPSLFYLLLGRCEWMQIDDAVRKMRTCLSQDESDDTFFWAVRLSGTSIQFMSLSKQQWVQHFSSTPDCLTTNQSIKHMITLYKSMSLKAFYYLFLLKPNHQSVVL